jgi:DNA repair exonuclease SbcCD ATPase subunit
MILFKTIRYKNLLSTGNTFTEIKLDQHPSTLIIGENGAGKSTMIEAISFALYGKSFRKINKPQLLNSINQKNLLVEIEFSIGNKEYLVRRGLKPTVFEIFVDGDMLNQDAASRDYQEILEKNILRLTHKSFSQIITLGTSTFIPFMQLPAHLRREFIEDLLDIQIFSTMNVLLKNRIQENKDKLATVDADIALCEQRIEVTKRFFEQIKLNNADVIEIKSNKIKEHQYMVDELDTFVAKALLQAEELHKQISDQGKVTNQIKKVSDLRKEIKFKLENSNKHVHFFENNDHCPTCTQDISEEFKKDSLFAKKMESEELETAIKKLTEMESEACERMEKIDAVSRQIYDLNGEIVDSNNKIKMYKKYNAELQKEINALSKFKLDMEVDTSDLERAKSELKQLHKDKEESTNKRTLLNTAALLLKDGGIKTKIIKQYVPIMNKLINKYLAAMDFFVQFELDENFNEKIKSRFRDEFSYSSFSEGEKMRIDLSLLFTWRAVAKLRNSASTNLLIMDEVFDSSLDAAGTEEFFKILSGIITDSNVFIISHKGDQLFDKFANVIKFEKHKNFSRIVQ